MGAVVLAARQASQTARAHLGLSGVEQGHVSRNLISSWHACRKGMWEKAMRAVHDARRSSSVISEGLCLRRITASPALPCAAACACTRLVEDHVVLCQPRVAGVQCSWALHAVQHSAAPASPS